MFLLLVFGLAYLIIQILTWIFTFVCTYWWAIAIVAVVLILLHLRSEGYLRISPERAARRANRKAAKRAARMQRKQARQAVVAQRREARKRQRQTPPPAVRQTPPVPYQSAAWTKQRPLDRNCF